MSKELSSQAQALLERALAEERPSVPGAARRAQLKRGLLGSAALMTAGQAAAASATQLAAHSAVVQGAVGVASLATFGKGLAVGLLVSGGLIGGTQYLTSASVSPTSHASVSRSRVVAPAPAATVADGSSPVPALPTTSSRAATAPSRVPGVTAPTQSARSLSAELELLTASQTALRDGRGAEALRLLERYDRTFPGGQLLGERLAAEVFAACQAGERGRALRAAQRFLEQDASSVLAERVRRSCAFGAADGGR